jgi:hypothetical protein
VRAIDRRLASRAFAAGCSSGYEGLVDRVLSGLSKAESAVSEEIARIPPCVRRPTAMAVAERLERAGAMADARSTSKLNDRRRGLAERIAHAAASKR